MSTRTDAMVCFGKMPTHGDFLRLRHDGDLVRALDEWVQQGLYVMKTRAESRIAERFDSGPPYCFCFHDPDGSRALAGVLQPSRDRVGRRYPLVIASEIESDVRAESWTRVPVRYADFFRAASELAASAASGTIAHRDLETHVDALADVRPIPEDAVTASLVRYLESTAFKTLATENWGYYEDTRKYLVFNNLLEADAAARERGTGTLARGFKLPVGAGATTDGFEPAFWLALCARLVRTIWDQASFFWRIDGSGDERSLFVFPGIPPPAGFVSLFAGTDRSPVAEETVDVQEVGRERGVAAVLSLPARYGDLLEDDEVTLGTLLQRL